MGGKGHGRMDAPKLERLVSVFAAGNDLRSRLRHLPKKPVPSSLRQARVDRFGEGDVVAVRIGDHQRLHLFARRPLTRVDAELLEALDLFLDAADGESERAVARALRE